MSTPTVPKRTPAATKPKRPRVDPATLPVVAWCGHNYDGEGEIVWCKTRGQARSQVAAELGCEFQEVASLKRYPQLDGFKGNLRQWQLANGWHFECQYGRCSRTCYGCEEGEADCTTVMDDDDHVFCSPEHRELHAAYWGMHYAIDQAILEDFKKLHPEVEVPFPKVSVGHNEWYGWVHAGPPLNQRVNVWEMVTVHEQHIWRPRP